MGRDAKARVRLLCLCMQRTAVPPKWRTNERKFVYAHYGRCRYEKTSNFKRLSSEFPPGRNTHQNIEAAKLRPQGTGRTPIGQGSAKEISLNPPIETLARADLSAPEPEKYPFYSWTLHLEGMRVPIACRFGPCPLFRGNSINWGKINQETQGGKDKWNCRKTTHQRL